MNRSRKLIGGAGLSFSERAQLRLLTTGEIAYRINQHFNTLETLIASYSSINLDTTNINLKDEELYNDISKLALSLDYDSYIDSLTLVSDKKEYINKAKKLDALEKRYTHIKKLAISLVQKVELKNKLSALNKKSKAVLPPPPVTNPVAPVLPPPPLAQALVAPIIQDPPNIIGNLLAEIDILKSELISKDIIIEETNKKLVTAFYFLSENEENASRTNVNSVSSDELDALREEIEVQATRIAELEGINKGKDAELTALRGHILDRNGENEALIKKSGEDDTTIAGLKAEITKLQNPPANPNEARLRELEAENARLTAENTDIQRQIDNTNAENVKLHADLGVAIAHIAALDAEIGIARARIADLEGQLVGLRDRNTQLEAEIARMGQVNSELGVARAHIAALEAELGDARGLIAKLTAETARIAVLEADLLAKKVRIQALNAELGIATARITELEGVQVVNHTQLQQENEALRKRIGELEREVSKLKQHIVDLEAQPISANNLRVSSESLLSDSVSSERVSSVNLDETVAQKQKVIDFKLIVRHTLFNDLKVLIENIKQNNKYDIISSLNEIIESFNQLYPTNKIQILSKPSNTKEINKKIHELYLIIKPK